MKHEQSSDATGPFPIGAYANWAASLMGDEPARSSLRRGEWTDLESWRAVARRRLLDHLALPPAATAAAPSVDRRYVHEGLVVEELSWQLGYGPPTRAVLFKPAGATGKLPGVLALHDHGHNKFFGWHKIAQGAGVSHPSILAHRASYGGSAWANQLAARGYLVLVPDAFAFGSRRVRIAEVPSELRDGLDDRDWREDPLEETVENVEAYNRWAAKHESVIARALFAAGTTWPGVWLGEDLRALDVLSARPDVDPRRIGCGGLSAGGLRTVFLGGLDSRVRCALCAGMMTTWRDYALNKCHEHTWMVFVPLLARELDYPEILGLRAPLPTLIQNNREDPLFTLAEIERADAMLREIYGKAGAPDRYRCDYYDGPHKFDEEMQRAAFDWFDRWLRDAG